MDDSFAQSAATVIPHYRSSNFLFHFHINYLYWLVTLNFIPSLWLIFKEVEENFINLIGSLVAYKKEMISLRRRHSFHFMRKRFYRQFVSELYLNVFWFKVFTMASLSFDHELNYYIFVSKILIFSTSPRLR